MEVRTVADKSMGSPNNSLCLVIIAILTVLMQAKNSFHINMDYKSTSAREAIAISTRLPNSTSGSADKQAHLVRRSLGI